MTDRGSRISANVGAYLCGADVRNGLQEYPLASGSETVNRSERD
jgi:hypothetical protein